MSSKSTAIVAAAVVAGPLIVNPPQPVEARPRAKIEKRSKAKVIKARKAKRVISHRHRNPKRYENIEKGCIVLDPRDRDLIVRTVMGEANNEPYNGKVGVASVVLNRLKDGGFGGNTVQGVLFKPRQFEPWNTRRGELMSYGPHSRGWDEAEAAVDDALNGYDPTGGATHFANVDTVKARGNSTALNWLRGMSGVTKIANHTFGRADGRGDGRVREIDGGYAPGGRDVFDELGLGFDDEDDGFGDIDRILSMGMATLEEETDDPRRLAVRSLITELLEGLAPLSEGQGQAVAPESAGVAIEEEEA